MAEAAKRPKKMLSEEEEVRASTSKSVDKSKHQTGLYLLAGDNRAERRKLRAGLLSVGVASLSCVVKLA